MKVRWAGVRAKESCWKGRERKPTRGGVWGGREWRGGEFEEKLLLGIERVYKGVHTFRTWTVRWGRIPARTEKGPIFVSQAGDP